MATLHVKTPNGNQYSISLETSATPASNAYLYLQNGAILQWGQQDNRETLSQNLYNVINEIQFPIEFSTEVYSLHLNPGWVGDLSAGTMCAVFIPQNELESTVTVSGFTLRVKLRLHWWMAIGK